MQEALRSPAMATFGKGPQSEPFHQQSAVKRSQEMRPGNSGHPVTLKLREVGYQIVSKPPIACFKHPELGARCVSHDADAVAVRLE